MEDKIFKFTDIPKFTGSGRYHVTVDLQDIPHIINRYKGTHRLEMNPEFQRGHVWTEQQQIAYMEFLLSGGSSGLDILFNHPNWMGSFEGRMVLVDGLQRLTAVLRFMNNEIPAHGHYYREYDRVKGELHFHVNDLKTLAEILRWYIELNSGGVVHTQEEIDRVKKMLAEDLTK